MRGLARRVPAARWLLSFLVVMLVLGHVCELPAYVELASHHHSAEGNAHEHSPEGPADEQLSSCDAVTATSNSGHYQVHYQVWTGLDMAVALPVIDAAPVGRTLQSVEDPARLPSRLPLFLLHAALRI